MKLLDVNILVGVYRDDDPHHVEIREWLRQTLAAGERILLTPIVVAGFVRVSTNTKVFPLATSPEEAIAQIDQLLRSRLVSWALPGPRHWQVFANLCQRSQAQGNLVSDAAIAAVAIEHGATLVSLDRDFARFPGLRWELPSR